MSKLGVLVFLTAAFVGCGGGTKTDNSGQTVPCSFTVAGHPGGQFNCTVIVLYALVSGRSELTMEVMDMDAAPFDFINISASEPGMPAAPSTWTQADPGATGVVELNQGTMLWGGGTTTTPAQGSYSFAFSSVSVKASSGEASDYNVHGLWSATTPALAGTGGNTLNLTGSF